MYVHAQAGRNSSGRRVQDGCWQRCVVLYACRSVTAAGALGDTARYTAFLAALAGIYIGVDEGIAATVGKDRYELYFAVLHVLLQPICLLAGTSLSSCKVSACCLPAALQQLL
jgi:hypothetical protein